MKKGVEYPHFLRCEITEEHRVSTKKCSKCRRMKAGTDSATIQPQQETKSRFLGGPHGWNMQNLTLRKRQNEGELEGKEKIEFVVGGVPRQSMFAPPTPKKVQPTSQNPRIVVHPLREHAANGHPLREHLIQRKPVPPPKEREGELFFDDRLSTANAAPKADRDAKRFLDHELRRQTQYQNSAAAQQNAELSFEDRPSTVTAATNAETDIQWILRRKLSTKSQYRGSAAATQRSELFFDHHPSTPKAAAIAQQDIEQILNRKPCKSRTRRPPTLPGSISELQSYAPCRPPIDTNKAGVFLNEIATRPRRVRRPLNFDDDDGELSFQQCPKQHTTMREATAVTLQQTEFAPFPELEQEYDRIPSCVVTGPPTEQPKRPKTLKQKKSFNALAYAQVPANFEFRRPQKQEQKIPASHEAKEALRVQTPAPLNLPKLTIARTAPSHSPNRANSRAGPGWENFYPLSPLAPAPLVVRKKKSPPGRLNTRPFLQTQRQAPRIANLQCISPLGFGGMLTPGTLKTEAELQTAAIARVGATPTPRAAPRIPSLQKFAPLGFEGTLLEGVARSMRTGKDRR
jgi:hypothetical protein